MKTQTAVLYETGKPLVIEELEIPEIKEGQVLVKILFSGICHSQINEIYAIKGEDKYLPHTLGHEASGIIENVGYGITKVKLGDYVVVSWIKGSGKDTQGIYYLKEEKRINAGSAATFSQYAIIAENRVTKISKKIPPEVAVLFGCAIPTGGGIILHELQAKKGDALAIFGVGGVGSSALLVAASLNLFSEIIAIDIFNHKLEWAKQLGATHTINALERDPVEAIKIITKGNGVDFAIESAGSKQAMEAAFHSLKDGKEGREGGLAIIAGNINKKQMIEIQPFDLIKGKRIRGTWGGKTDTDLDIPFYEQRYLEGKLPLEKLLTKIFPLQKINTALETLKKGEVLRAAISLHEHV